jgi:hypothetical protein
LSLAHVCIASHRLSLTSHSASYIIFLIAKTNKSQPAFSHHYAYNTTRTMPPKEKAEVQTFSFETMACVLAVMDAKGATLGTKAYELMATLDGNRSASAFQHQFRAVKHRGKELASDLTGETATPTPKTPKTPKAAKKPATASTKKRNSMFHALTRLLTLH